MDDLISNFTRDLFQIVDDLINKKIIQKTFNKKNISIDFSSQSKKGDISTNLLIILKNFIIKETDLKTLLINKIKNLTYVEVVDIAEVGFINIFFNDNYLIENLKKILILGENYGSTDFGNGETINV